MFRHTYSAGRWRWARARRRSVIGCRHAGHVTAVGASGSMASTLDASDDSQANGSRHRVNHCNREGSRALSRRSSLARRSG